MKLCDILIVCENIAPKALAYDYDNVGLIVGTLKDDINKVLVALDCTLPVIEEAIEFGADMIITHHPLLTSPVKRILPDMPETMAVFRLIKNNIGHIAMHTNLDCACYGVNDCIAESLELVNTEAVGVDGLARIGELESPMTLYELSIHVEEKLSTKVRVCGEAGRIIKSVAVIGGSGGSCVSQMQELGADVLITGEMKHSQAIDAMHLGLCAIVAGHFETETIVLKSLVRRLQNQTNGVQYKLAVSNRTPLWSI